MALPSLLPPFQNPHTMFARVAVVALLALLALSTVSAASVDSSWSSAVPADSAADSGWPSEFDSTPLMKELDMRHSEFLMALGDSSSSSSSGGAANGTSSSSSSSTGPAGVRGGSAAFHESAQCTITFGIGQIAHVHFLRFVLCPFFPLLGYLR
jgi:hypothetical protein